MAFDRSGGLEIDIEGSIGELDYDGFTLRTLDLMTETAAKGIVAPAVQNEINRITGETEKSVVVKRRGYFNPNGKMEPMWDVASSIEHITMLEYGYDGRNAVFRPAARRRKVKSAISNLVKTIWGEQIKIQVRNFKLKRKK